MTVGSPAWTPPRENIEDVADLIVFVAAFVVLVWADSVLGAYLDARAAARAALRTALDRGEIRPEEYAAHLRALEERAA